MSRIICRTSCIFFFHDCGNCDDKTFVNKFVMMHLLVNGECEIYNGLFKKILILLSAVVFSLKTGRIQGDREEKNEEYEDFDGV